MKNFFITLKICMFAVLFLTAFHANAGSRYLRLTALGGVSSYDIWFGEIDWMVGSTAYPTAHATGATPTITSTFNTSLAWRAFDGVSTTRWNPGVTFYPYSITCDLGEGVSIDPTEVRIAVEWNARTMSTFLCEGSTDNITWTTLSIKSGLVESNWVSNATNSFIFDDGSGDTQAPTAPAALTTSAIAQTTFTMSWAGSTDDKGVKGYLVYQGATFVGFTTTNTFTLSLLDASTTYNMSVKAIDTAANCSASSSIEVTTAAAILPTGHVTILTSDFTGTAPSSNLPWTKTSILDSHITYSGWTLGAKTYTINPQIDNMLAVRVSAGGTPSTLQEAINDNEYVTFTITPKEGSILDLNSAVVTFKVKLELRNESPSKYSVFTGIKGFTVGKEVYTTSTDVNPNEINLKQPITFNFPATGYDNISNPIEVRIYLYGAIYSGKPASIAYWTMSGAVSRQVIILNSGTQTTASSISSMADVILSGNGTTLTIDADKTVNNIILEPGTKLDLSNNTLTLTGDLTLKADKTASSSVSVTHGMAVNGNVSLQKTVDNSKWYFVSFPCNIVINDIAKVTGTEELVLGTNWWIKYYDGGSRVTNLGATSNWKQMSAGQTLTANQGYIIGLANALTGDYVLSFPLNKNLVTSAENAKTVGVTAFGEGSVAANHVGWNLVGIPYLSKFAGSGVGANYLTFHTGATYTQSAKADVLSINPFDAFFVQANTVGDNITGTALSFATNSRQLARSSVETDLSDRVQLNFTSSTGSDKTNLIMNENQSIAYEINQDLEKWLTINTDIPQVYTNLEGIRYAYNALPMNSVFDLPIGFYTKTAGQNTIGVNASQAPGLSKLLLTDNLTGSTTDLLISDYGFTAAAGTDDSRFVITAQRVITGNNYIGTEGVEPAVSVVNGKLMLGNISGKATVMVYDAIGRMVVDKKVNTNSLEIPLHVVGMVTIQIGTANKNWVRKCVINQR